MATLSTTYMGLALRNPIIAGSSGLTDSPAGIKILEEAGAGAVVLKSLFEEEILLDLNAKLKRMQAESFLYPETVEYYENQDPLHESTLRYLETIRECKRISSLPIIASVNCLTAGQWTYFPRHIEEAGADALELNLFILPSDIHRSGTENEKIYFDIISQVLQQVKIPVALKLSPYFSGLAHFFQQLSQTGAKALVLFNRFYNPDIDIENMEISSSHVLSEASDLSLSLRWIAILAKRISCELAASTGIHSGEAVIKQLLAGAQTVQIASILYRNGPDYIQQMLKELEKWMDSKGFHSLEDFRGKLSREQSQNPAAFERVQFMKYFRGYPPEMPPAEFT